MINLETAKVTAIQFFDNSYETQIDEDATEITRDYSANIIVNDELVIQLAGSDYDAYRAGVPSAVQQYYNNEELQDWAHENLDIYEVEKFLEDNGIENNFEFLCENGEII